MPARARRALDRLDALEPTASLSPAPLHCRVFLCTLHVYIFLYFSVWLLASPQPGPQGTSTAPRATAVALGVCLVLSRSRPAGPTCALSPAASCNPCPWGGAPPLCRWRALRPANVFFLFVLRPCSSPCLTSPLSGLPHVPQFGAAFSSLAQGLVSTRWVYLCQYMDRANPTTTPWSPLP